MSESIDKVFVKAISTIKALSSKSSRNSISRPPLQTRVKLYGLYKQATEGDVDGLQISLDSSSDDEATTRKLEAWKQQSGLSKTEAKKLYIECLIEAMSSYANDSIESRDLLNDLEFMWEQVKDLPLSSYEPLSGGEPQQVLQGASISRSHSPALSLYRMASGGGSRIPSAYERRNSVDNFPPTITKNRSISTNTAVSSTLQQQKYSQMNTSSISNIPNRSITPSSGSKDIQFLKWQNEINLTLNKLSYELANMRSMSTIQATSTPTKQSTPITQTPYNSSNSNNNSKLIRTLLKIRQLVISLLIKIYKASKKLLSQAIVDSVIIFILVSIARKLKLFNSFNITPNNDYLVGQQLGEKIGKTTSSSESAHGDLIKHTKDAVYIFLKTLLGMVPAKSSKRV